MQYVSYTLVFVTLLVLGVTKSETHNITHPKTKCDGKEKAFTLLDAARDFMNKAKNFYPDCIDSDLECGKKEKSLAFLEVASNLITGIKKTFPTCPECPKVPEPECPTVREPECPTFPEPECPTVPEPECPTVPEPVCPTVPEPECPKVLKEVPVDCSEIRQRVKGASGVYTIWPRGHKATDKGLPVYCDMDTDGGGWTVIQRRGQFSTPKDYFYKDWNSYKIGFGDITEEFWLGNDNIHLISNQANYTIRFDLKASDGDIGYAEYDTFRIEDELSKYELHISGYSGSVGDAMKNHTNMQFTTKDQNNSYITRSCAKNHEGAWWYNTCDWSSMNGLYQPGVDSFKGIIWRTWKKEICLARVEMKLRPERI